MLLVENLLVNVSNMANNRTVNVQQANHVTGRSGILQ
jgi:hypothetical protein